LIVRLTDQARMKSWL